MKKFFKDFLFIFFIVFALFLLSDQPSFSRTLKFVQLSDIHYSLMKEDNGGYKLLYKSIPLLQDAIEQINCQEHIDFVIVTGDAIDRPIKESIYGVTNELNKLKYPWYYALGNHDTSPSGFVTKDVLVKVLSEQNSNFTFGSTYYTFKPKRGFRVIVLDGARVDKVSSNGIIPKEQLDWLDCLLDKSKKDTVLIFLHFPLLPPFDAKQHEIVNADEFKAVIDKYDMPIGLFTGHYHFPKITKRSNVLHVSSPALISYPNAFRIVEVDNKRKQVVFKFEFVETGLKDFQAKAKLLVLSSKRYHGRDIDRNPVIIINKK